MSTSTKSEEKILDQWIKKCSSLSREEAKSSQELSFNAKNEVVMNGNITSNNFEKEYLEIQNDIKQYIIMNQFSGSSLSHQLSHWVQRLHVVSSSSSTNFITTTSACYLPIIAGCLDAIVQSNEIITVDVEVQIAMANFLLPYCAYNKYNNGDNDKYVRNRAIHCLTTLISLCQWGDTTTTTTTHVESTLKQLLYFAKCGVENYISGSTDTTKETDEEEEEEEENYFSQNINNNMSTLIRAQRSICIKLLQTALHQYDSCRSKPTTTTTTTTTITSDDDENYKVMVEFTIFCCSCLHGETDPRCLLDFFHLIHLCQTSFSSSLALVGRRFPEGEVFDAVAPYYPIRFIQPPNDPYGITREDLRIFLNRILLYNAPSLPSSSNDQQSYPPHPQNVFSLTFSLFLEQLVTASEDEDDEEEDNNDGFIIEACDDLLHLIFGESQEEVVAATTTITTSKHMPLGLNSAITPPMMEELSNCLHNLFYHYMQKQHRQQYQEENGGNSKNRSHPVVDKCLFVTSKISSAAMEDELWKAFHRTPKITNLITNIITRTPHLMEAKIGVIYLCSLISSDATASNALFNDCLMPLIDLLQRFKEQNTIEHDNYGEKEESKVVASLYAITALVTAFSKNSSRKDTSPTDRIPHGLPTTLLDFCGGPCNAIAAAAISALESLLVNHFYIPSNEKAAHISFTFLCETLQFLVECITVTNYNDNCKERNLSCAHAVGTLLGSIYAGIEEEEEEEEGSIMSSSVKNHLQTSFIVLKKTSEEEFSYVCSKIHTVFQNLLQSCAHQSNHQPRFDWIALSRSCQGSASVAATAIQTFISTILNNGNSSSSIGAAAALGRLVCQGGEHAISDWKNNINNALNIILSTLPTLRGNEQVVSQEDLEAKTQLSLKILSPLTPCFELLGDNIIFCRDIVSVVVDDIANGWKVKVLLPVLATLTCCRNNSCLPSIFTGQDDMIHLSLYLCDLILNKNCPAASASITRRAAISCLFSILLSNASNDDHPPIPQVLLQESISPSIWKAFHQPGGEVNMSTRVECFYDAVCLAAVMGTASAYQGKRGSAIVSDQVTKFLLDLCCHGRVQPPFSSNMTIESSNINDDGQPISEKVISVVGGMAFGTMLTVHCDSLRSPFWKQRAASIAVIELLNVFSASQKSQGSSSNFLLGCLLALSHFVCCTTPLAALGGDDQIQAIAHAISMGLSIYTAAVPSSSSGSSSSSEDVERKGISSFQTVGLSALLKIVSIAPLSTLPPILLDSHYTVLRVLLATLTTVPRQQHQTLRGTKDCGVHSMVELEDNQVARQLLALECFLQVSSRTTYWKDGKIRSVIIHRLALALDSPSYAVRNAAGMVQNIWSK